MVSLRRWFKITSAAKLTGNTPTGFELVLYGMTMRILFQRKQWRTLYRSKKDVFFLAFSTLLLLCATTGLATNCLFGEEWWISHQNYPGGSEQWFADNAAVWYETWGTTASILAQLLADAFLVSSAPSFRSTYGDEPL